MKEKLKRLEKVLLDINHPIMAIFEECMSKSDIEYALAFDKMYVDKDLIDLYLWKGGINGSTIFSNPIIEISYIGSFIDFKSAGSLYELDKFSKKELKKELPIFYNTYGDCTVIDLNPKSKTKGQLLICAPSITLNSGFVTIYDSLKCWVDSIVECYEKKAYKWENNELIIDFDLEQKISENLNPNSEFWTITR